jgi:hypothetical protein
MTRQIHHLKMLIQQLQWVRMKRGQWLVFAKQREVERLVL